MGKHKHRFSFDSTNFISYIWLKRRVLVTFSILAMIISAIVSLTITPKFRSTVVLFPASSSSVSKSLFSDNLYSQNDLLKFGSEQEGEQLLQVLNSNEIREKIIQKLNLRKHYKIDTASRFWRTSLRNEYDGNIKFRRTEFMSIIIDVLDTDPDTAALIANEITNQIDTVMTRIQHERAQKALDIMKVEYNEMIAQMNKMEDSLKHIRELGVVNYEAQSKAFNEAYVNAISLGHTNNAKLIEVKLKTLAKYGGAYVALSELLKNETERLSSLNGKYMNARADAEQTISHKFVVEQAYKAEKKAYPKRMLIVFITTLSTFFTVLLLLIFRDSIAYKRKE